MAEIVENDGLVAARGKKRRDGTANVPSTSGHQYTHESNAPFQALWDYSGSIATNEMAAGLSVKESSVRRPPVSVK
jgi:hypothetical protein